MRNDGDTRGADAAKRILHDVSAALQGGQVMGSILIGLIRSFKNVHAVSGDTAASLAEGVKSTSWYPMAYFFRILDAVCRRDIDYAPILFQAGVAFIEDWYANGGGKERVACAADFLRLQGGDGGYASVHRGNADEIGWQKLLELDEAAGRATVVCVNPYPNDFERGVFHGGMLLAGDVQFVHVDVAEEPYGGSLHKKTVTIRFRVMPDEETKARLDGLLANMSPEKSIDLPAPLHEALAWRLKAAEEQHRLDLSFYEKSSLLLSKATEEIYELSRKLDDLAHHDELTGLLNRRAILKRAESLLALSVRQGWPLAFVMIDIDHFKRVNDVLGHAAGDDTLRQVAARLKGRLRDSDLLGRVGGEEFLVVLPNADADGATTVAESLRTEVANHVLAFAAGRCVPVTISLGVAVAAGHHGGKVESYVKQADQALYGSKHAGRNRVTLFSAEPDGSAALACPN